MRFNRCSTCWIGNWKQGEGAFTGVQEVIWGQDTGVGGMCDRIIPMCEISGNGVNRVRINDFPL